MISVVTDSTSYIPSDLLRQHQITVVPLKVLFGAETYDEISGLSNADFYRRLATTSDFPTTSQPASGEFRQAFQQILQRDPTAQILVLTISSRLSGTYSAAVTAAEGLPEAAITVFDSLSAAMGLGLMALTATEMAAAGHSLPSILSRLEQMRRDTHIVLVVDTLEYLKRGGRIGTAAAFLGTLLNTKPILAVVEGKLQPLDRVRTKKRALERLFVELESKLITPRQPLQAGVMHIAAEAEMDSMAALLRDRFNITRLYTSELGPVIGAHLGPGALGVGICLEPFSVGQ
ncbi:MAG: DegV family protein [Anaerolineales bacterium]|nr:DegV family protein [Anaerolineales bacterium]